MRRMRGLAMCMLWSCVLALAACDAQRTPAPQILAPVEQADGRIEWGGMQPCADCEGIDTRLVLTRERGRQRFVLTETYLAERRVPFVVTGAWRREDALLRLDADDGARLGYVVLDDGRLQPRDARGRRLRTADGDGLLQPLATGPER